MGRYTGPVCQLCRQTGEKLFLKATRCYTEKCPLGKKKGGKAISFRPKVSEYGRQLREKRKAKYMAGLLEKQFAGYMKKALRSKEKPGEKFLRLLACRLDNVVYGLGFASSRRSARQLVTHGHFLVNGKKVDIPSFQLKPGDEITLKQKSKDNPLIKQSLESVKTRGIPSWLSFDEARFTGKVEAFPKRDEIYQDIKEQLIVEFYRK